MKTQIILISTILLLCLSLYKCQYDLDDLVENPYRELRLSPWSSMKEIKLKYNQMVKKYHPDKNKKVGAQDKFMRIQKAYEKLKELRKDEDDDDIDDPFSLVLQDTFQLCCIVFLGLGSLYAAVWISYKIYEFIWVYVLYLAISFIVVDRLFPHYFNNMTNQYVFSIMLANFVFFREKLFDWVRSFFGKKTKKEDSADNSVQRGEACESDLKKD